MTHRQFITWHEWLKEEWNTPDRHDAYIMMLAREVHTILMKSEDSKKVNIKDFRLKFNDASDSATQPASIEQRTINAKTAWFGRLKGLPGVVYTPAPSSSENADGTP